MISILLSIFIHTAFIPALESLVPVLHAAGTHAAVPLIPAFPNFVVLAQASPIPGLNQFIDFLQTISLLVGICLILFGAWQIHQGRVAEGALSLVAGFLCCATVPIIRLIAAWTGFPLN